MAADQAAAAAVRVTSRLLAGAAADGHTALPAALVRAVLAGQGLGDGDAALAQACQAGQVLAYAADGAKLPPPRSAAGWGDGGEVAWVALASLGRAEERVAAAVGRLLARAAPWPAGARGPSEPSGPSKPAPASGEPDVLGGARAMAAAAGVSLLLTGAGPTGRAAVDAVLDAASGHGLRAVTASAGTPAPSPAGEARPWRPLAELTEIAADLVVVTEADRLDAPSAAELLERIPDGARLLLAGDLAGLGPSGPGQVLADLAASGAAPVTRADQQPEPADARGRLAHGVRCGRLLDVRPADHEVALVAATDAEHAVRLAARLATESIPRAFGLRGAEVGVLAPLRHGPAGVAALAAALAAAAGPGTPAPPDGWASTVHQAAGRRWPAVVAVLATPHAGVLTRALVYTALTRADQHLSVVHVPDPALGHAVAHIPARPRRTRLAALARAAAQSTSSSSRSSSSTSSS